MTFDAFQTCAMFACITLADVLAAQRGVCYAKLKPNERQKWLLVACTEIDARMQTRPVEECASDVAFLASTDGLVDSTTIN